MESCNCPWFNYASVENIEVGPYASARGEDELETGSTAQTSQSTPTNLPRRVQLASTPGASQELNSQASGTALEGEDDEELPGRHSLDPRHRERCRAFHEPGLHTRSSLFLDRKLRSSDSSRKSTLWAWPMPEATRLLRREGWQSATLPRDESEDHHVYHHRC